MADSASVGSASAPVTSGPCVAAHSGEPARMSTCHARVGNGGGGAAGGAGGGDGGGGSGGGGIGGGGDGDGGKGGEWHSSALHTWILSEPQPVPAHFVFEFSMYFFGGSAHPCASHSAFASSNVASKGLMVVFGLTAELQIDLHWPMSGCASLAIQHRTAPRFDEGMYVRSAMPPKAPWPSVLTHMSSYKGTVRSIHTLPGRPAASIVVVPSSAKPSASTSGAADAARAASIAVVSARCAA